jgi:hypothetical protein
MLDNGLIINFTDSEHIYLPMVKSMRAE